MIRVAVADDQELVRTGFTTMVGTAPDLIVVGQAANGEEAVAIAREQSPDVFLMDVRMPVLDGIEATRQITSDPATQHTRVVILTTFDLDDYVYAALRAGASGFLLKDVVAEDLLNGIRVVAQGDALLAPSITRRLIEQFAQHAPPAAATVKPPELATLTEREREVLGLVAQGLSNAEIADALIMSPATAKTHVARILMKLHAHDRAQLVMIAYETGLVVPGQGRRVHPEA